MFTTSPYSLGSPVFATPALVKVLSAASYSLGSPVFATPVLTTLQLVLHANTYSLGSPVFATPILQQQQFSPANSWTLSSPVFATPAIAQTHTTYTNAYSLMPLGFATPVLTEKNVLSAVEYDLSSPIFAFPSPLGLVDWWLSVQSYSLEFLRFARPRLQEQVLPGPPPFYLETISEATSILMGMLSDLLASVPSEAGLTSADLRQQVGALMATANTAIRTGALATPLWGCFEAARIAGATLDGMDRVRQDLLLQNPQSNPAMAVVDAGVTFALAEDAKIITTLTFVSRNQIDTMMDRMQAAFEPAIETAADSLDSASYQTVLALYGSVTNYLATTQLPLPRIVTYQMGQAVPALWLANYIYGDGSRYDELIAENFVVHPAFMPRTISALSA
jgi:hypothetical protein